MEKHQDHQKVPHSSSGHESHEVHVCTKCGWPFPNPHPSAKNRRHHKKLCGSIEGYKLGDGVVDLDGSSHSNVSDDELIPSPKVLETAGNEKGRSEEEVFSDAATEFAVGGGVGATGGSTLDAEKLPKESDGVQSVERGPDVADAVKPPESTNDKLGNSSEYRGPTSSVVSYVSDCPTEDSALQNNNSVNASSDGFKPIKFETQKDVPCESNNAIDDVSDASSTLATIDPSQSASQTPKALKPLPSISDNDLIRAKTPETAVSPEVVEGIYSAKTDALTETKGEVDINEINNAGIMLEDFKDHKEHSNQSATSEFELAKEREGTEVPVVEDSALSNHGEDSAISTSVSDVFHNKVTLEEGAGFSQIGDTINKTKGAGEIVAPIGAMNLEIDGCGPTGDYLGKGTTTDGDYKKSSHESTNVSDLGCDHEMGSTNVRDFDKAEIEKHDITDDAYEVATDHANGESKVNAIVPESVSPLPERHTVADDFVFGSVEKLPSSACANSSSVGVDSVSEIKVGVTENEHKKMTPSLGGEDNPGKERAFSLHDPKASIQSSAATEDNSAKEFGESDQQRLGGSIIDFPVDSSSITDSLENNWGSISALSGVSDVQAVVDSESLPSIESQAVAGERSNSRKSEPSSGGQNFDKSEMFEPPSFMTLVEPQDESDHKSTAPESLTSQNKQLPSQSALRAGWFPSITNVVNESQGRKKNEEIIAKVTNWSTGKQHTPLKNLLGEASSQDARAKSPKRKENQKGNSNNPTTVNSILAPESPLAQDGNDNDVKKEWNLPERYPAEIKREKRKSKSRPYWAQFMCCSSVH